jgi:hypothetical protein
MNRDELKAIVQREPTLRGTLATLDEELDPLDAHVTALRKRRHEIIGELETIEEAKHRLEAGDFDSPGSQDPDPTPPAPPADPVEPPAPPAPVDPTNEPSN